MLGRVQDKRKRRLLVVVNHGFMNRAVAHEAVKLLRRMGDIESLDVILESSGGDVDAAYKTLTVIRSCAKDTAIIVPFYTKSAATLIALEGGGGDRLILCKGGELGPMDPQVLDTITNYHVPASSVKETAGFLEGLEDPLIKASLTDKIPTLMVGACKAATIPRAGIGQREAHAHDI